MATVKGANVTKYESPGGDNVIADGLIKTVEKVWIDSYAFTGAIATSTSILIAKIPKNKKLTDVVVFLPIMGTAGSYSTIYVCTGATTSILPYFGICRGNGTSLTAVDQSTVSTCRLGYGLINEGAIHTALAADTDVYIMIDAQGSATSGTIRTIVKYT